MLESLLPSADAMAPWIAAWWWRIEQDAGNPLEIADAMDAVNPLYIPRNHLVEEALDAAEAGDLAPWLQLLGVVRNPYEVRPGLERFTRPAPADAGPYRTFCGTCGSRLSRRIACAIIGRAAGWESSVKYGSYLLGGSSF